MNERILYLHGFASGPNSSKARFFRARCAESGIPIEFPDLADGNFEGLTITGQLEVIERAARGEAVNLIGSSMGGYLAALYASQHLEVKKAVLLAPAFCFVRRWPATLGEERLSEWRRTGVLPIFHYADQVTRNLGIQLLEDGARYPDFPDFSQPALILHGNQDPVVPVEFSREFAASHTNVRLVELPSGHELTDVVDRLWSETDQFLRG